MTYRLHFTVEFERKPLASHDAMLYAARHGITQALRFCGESICSVSVTGEPGNVPWPPPEPGTRQSWWRGEVSDADLAASMVTPERIGRNAV